MTSSPRVRGACVCNVGMWAVVWTAGERGVVPVLWHGPEHRRGAHAVRMQAVVPGADVHERAPTARAAGSIAAAVFSRPAPPPSLVLHTKACFSSRTLSLLPLAYSRFSCLHP